MRTLANSENPDEMPHYQRKKYNFYLKIITFDPSIYALGHLKLFYINLEEGIQ